MNLSVAYELFEVRNGKHGLSPILRLGDVAPVGTVESFRTELTHVFKKLGGEDGNIKRKNAARISREIRSSWGEKGRCWEEIKRLLEIFKL